MENLRQFKTERENKDYFRTVRNNLSLRKRTASYLAVGAIAGVGGGLAMLIPAIGPLIAAPTYLTLLSVSTTLVGGAVLTGVPLAAQYALLRKDNKLYKAERGIQSAAKIQTKLNEKEYTDRQYARMIRKRDKKLEKFQKVYDTYERKTQKLAGKVHGVYNVEAKELNTDDNYVPGRLGRFTDKGSFVYNRRMKKFAKYRPIFDELHEDLVDFQNIRDRNGTSVEDFKANLHERSVPQRTVRGAKKVGHATKTGAGYVASGAGYVYGHSKNGLKRVYGATKGFYNNHSHREYESSYGSNPAFGMPNYIERNASGMSIYEQLRESAASFGLSDSKGELTRYNTRKKTYEVIQPKVIRGGMMNKENYFEHLQNESIHSHPFPIHNRVTMQDYQEFYDREDANLSNNMSSIANSYSNFEKRFNDAQDYIDKESIETKLGNGEIFVQLDIDKPNFTVYKRFDDLQKAMAYTRCLEKFGADKFRNKECDGFRMTTWEKELDGTYTPVKDLCTKVSDEKELELSEKAMQNAFIREMYLLHLNNYIKSNGTSPASTLEVIQGIDDLAGYDKLSAKELLERVKNMPAININELKGNENELDDKTLSELDKEFYTRQFYRNSERTNETTV